ncbi:hypothetical protein V5799_031498 [Amblyomma americanum]|uniref:Uncharacterized protein n=1 Tax=Amblyomma americanum TaxID=6943 RepID=A0AAQ4EK72_AMBAM
MLTDSLETSCFAFPALLVEVQSLREIPRLRRAPGSISWTPLCKCMRKKLSAPVYAKNTKARYTRRKL